MLLKLQLPDSSGLQLFASVKSTTSRPGVSYFPGDKLESTSNSGVRWVLEKSNGDGFRIAVDGDYPQLLRKVDARWPDIRRCGNPDWGKNGCSENVCCWEKKMVVHTKRSKKCANYGGRVPEILEALEKNEDIDEALRPWGERLS